MILLLLVTVSLGLLIWGSNLQVKVKKLKEQLRPITSADQYARTVRSSADSELSKAREKAALIANAAQQEIGGLEDRIDLLRAETRTAKQELELINEGIRLKADDIHLLEVGYYEPVYGFEDLAKYRQAIEEIREAQKAMLRMVREGQEKTAAAYATATISYNGSDAEGKKLVKRVLQLMLRAFNGECDAFIARVNYRNVTTMQKRIRSSFEQINKIAEIWHCQLSQKYLLSRLDELNLVYEYVELQEKNKEEQAYLREQEREDEKARRDSERVKKDAERAKQDAERRRREEAERKAAIDEAVQETRQAMEAASNKQKAYYKEQLVALEQQRDESAHRLAERDRQLADALERNQRAISLAQQTRSGHVYVFSNIGSFGDNVYKIGMTRREDPEERRRELGDASVPFPFDKHACIWTEDAPALERALHQHFDRRRLNLANDRKEFFRITIEEIKAEVEKIKDRLGITADIRWTLLAEAKDFRLSEAKRKHFEEGDGVD
jgi:hypothetical protein